MKIGAVTIGQSPRVDVTPDILPIFPENTELIQAGALDGLTREQIMQMKPEEGDYVLVSRLNDGTFAKFGKSFILKRMQECIERLEEQKGNQRLRALVMKLTSADATGESQCRANQRQLR